MLHDHRFAPLDDRIRLKLASILVALSQDMESIGAAICDVAGVADQYCMELQRIDLVAQKQREIARIIDPVDVQQAIRSIPIEALRTMLLE